MTLSDGLNEKAAARNQEIDPSRCPGFAQHFVLVACDARADGDINLAEHLLEIAYGLFEQR